jgi:hypothetical protein
MDGAHGGGTPGLCPTVGNTALLVYENACPKRPLPSPGNVPKRRSWIKRPGSSSRRRKSRQRKTENRWIENRCVRMATAIVSSKKSGARSASAAASNPHKLADLDLQQRGRASRQNQRFGMDHVSRESANDLSSAHPISFATSSAIFSTESRPTNHSNFSFVRSCESTIPTGAWLSSTTTRSSMRWRSRRFKTSTASLS